MITKVNRFKSRMNAKWWFRSIRSYNWFSFRYWWFNYILWTILIALLLFWICRFSYEPERCDDAYRSINDNLRNIHRTLENCCHCTDIPPHDGLVPAPRTDSLGIGVSDTLALGGDSLNSRLDHLRDSLGGSVGKITITLAWNTTDDLDLYVEEPGGAVVYYGNKRSPCGGRLDVDKNRNSGVAIKNPIENVFYSSPSCNGKYRISVMNYSSRSGIGKVPYILQVRVGSEMKTLNLLHSGIRKRDYSYEFIYTP